MMTLLGIAPPLLRKERLHKHSSIMLGKKQRSLLMDSGQERAVNLQRKRRRVPCAVQEGQVVKELVEGIF